MRRITAITLSAIIVLASLVLTACGGGGDSDLADSRYVGTWKATSVSIAGESEELTGGEYLLILNEDGTGQFTSSAEGEEEVSDITWELTSDGFRTAGDTKLKFKDDGDNIKTKILGANLIFEKQ